MHKINILSIIGDHLRTLKVSGKSRPSVIDLVVFFGLPIMLALVLYCNGVTVTDAILSQFSVGFSIIFGFLLNVQVLIFSIGKRNYNQERVTLLKETFANVSFAILISLIVLCFSISLMFVEEKNIFRFWSNYILFYLLGVLLLTIIMIFKRVHISLQKEMDG